eukprot:CAMPEP_0206475952 /NCGR_PEP_ID=MMETSP0324_2-20121206/34404_2 /ASSEMBLY_ACC=CAM_ASM_000836 /TAXON_ID=2866 /ORGANISM="Crypthecodinium cohnii, Strain Seligo" /LENGTH=169 /DNA_ID=CAMNT_0053951445 /DNA_START=353 /DNA_END=863 /DNA_ORIENTATION=-
MTPTADLNDQLFYPDAFENSKNSGSSIALIRDSNLVVPTETIAVGGFPSAKTLDIGGNRGRVPPAPAQVLNPAYFALGKVGNSCSHWTVKMSTSGYRILPVSDKFSDLAKLSLKSVEGRRRPKSPQAKPATTTGTQVPGPLSKMISGANVHNLMSVTENARRVEMTLVT